MRQLPKLWSVRWEKEINLAMVFTNGKCRATKDNDVPEVVNKANMSHYRVERLFQNKFNTHVRIARPACRFTDASTKEALGLNTCTHKVAHFLWPRLVNDSPNRDCVSVEQTLLGKKCDNESEFFWNTYVGIRVNQDITYPLIVTNTLTWHQLHLANNVMAVSVNFHAVIGWWR